jgi:prepilin-type processing-associated H-X9-DG protein
MFSYPGNGVFCWKDTWRVCGVINPTRTWNADAYLAVSLSSINFPAATILLSERRTLGVNSWMAPEGIEGAFSPWATVIMGSDGVDHGNQLPGQQGGAVDGSFANAQGIDGTWMPANPKSTGTVGLHTGNGNFAFTDGHVKAMNPIRTVNADPSIGNTTTPAFLKMWDRTRTTDD